MANTFIKASFVLSVTTSEAELIRLALDASNMLEHRDDAALGRDLAFEQLGPAFAAAFPPGEDDPFAGFMALFDDANFPYFDCDITFGESPEAGHELVHFSGDQIAVDAVAKLIFATVRSALPVGFEYCLDCDRMRVGVFGGGYVAITAKGITFGTTGRLLERAMAREETEGADGYVLVTRHAEEGLLFWNHAAGFGDLFSATVFSEAEAQDFAVPIASDQPEWLPLPAPLA